MCFEVTSPGVYKYRGVTYHEVDCGAGGNCLFLSLAYLLRLYGLDDAATHKNVRWNACEILEYWCFNDHPNWIDTVGFEIPDFEEVYEMGRNGTWGTKTEILAVVAHYNTIHVTILGPDTEDVHHINNLLSDDPRTRILLFYSGYNHYRALVPQNLIHHVPAGMRVDKKEEFKLSRTLFASVKTKSTSGSFTNTSSSSAQSYLEIHHIDVGQGDSTLIYVKDHNKSIVKSILIDTGERFEDVENYLKTRIMYGDFRPIDMLIMSHWDKDHMGAAAALIRSGKYTHRDLIIIDVGDPENEDQDAEHFIKEFGSHEGRRMPSLYEPLVDDCLGFSLTCYMFNGLVGSEKGEGYVTSCQDWESYTHSSFFPETGKKITGGIISARNQYFPPVKDKNNRSIALVINFHGFTYFTAGDLSGYYEEIIAHTVQSNFGHACAWKLGHHGAAEASSPKTLLHLRPRFGVVSCGTDNDYGHPSGAAIEHLQGLNKYAPCDFYVTSKIPAKASGKKFQPGQIKGIAQAKDSEGHIMIKVSSADKDMHKFEVYSNSHPIGTSFTCGIREFDKSHKIEKSKKRAFRLTTDEEDEEVEKRRRKRISKILTAIETALKDHKDVDDSWLNNEGVKKAMIILANRIRHNEGEDCAKEKVAVIVNLKLNRREINSAHDLEKALLWTG